MKHLIVAPFRFLYTVWRLRKSLWNFRSWDSSFNIDLFVDSLRLTKEGIKKNNHLTNNKAVIEAMGRFIRTYERIDRNFPFDYAKWRMNGWEPGEITLVPCIENPKLFEMKQEGDEVLKSKFYNYFFEMENILQEKMEKQLFDKQNGIYTWWD